MARIKHVPRFTFPTGPSRALIPGGPRTPEGENTTFSWGRGVGRTCRRVNLLVGDLRQDTSRPILSIHMSDFTGYIGKICLAVLIQMYPRNGHPFIEEFSIKQIWGFFCQNFDCPRFIAPIQKKPTHLGGLKSQRDAYILVLVSSIVIVICV